MNKVYYKIVERDGLKEFHCNRKKKLVEKLESLSRSIPLDTPKEYMDGFDSRIKNEIYAFGLIEVK